MIEQSVEQIRFSTSSNPSDNLDKTIVFSDNQSVQINISFDLHNNLHLIFLPQVAIFSDGIGLCYPSLLSSYDVYRQVVQRKLHEKRERRHCSLCVLFISDRLWWRGSRCREDVFLTPCFVESGGRSDRLSGNWDDRFFFVHEFSLAGGILWYKESR